VPEIFTYSLDTWISRTGQETPEEDTERWVSYSIADLYPDWQKDAHCAGVGLSYYFGDDAEQPTMSIKQVRQASKLCDVCPVYTECLTWALDEREEYGVWAGTSGRVRRRIFKLIDDDLTTVAEVVERFRNGQGDTYRLSQEPKAKPHTSAAEELAAEPGTLGEGSSGICAEGGREAAI
jgi:WhiB family redox-sensing transcriptional regulator